MPVRKWFPFVAVENSEKNEFIGVQLYCPSSWQIELFRHKEPLTLLGGLADFDYGHWCKEILPGKSFTTPKAVVAVGNSLLKVCDMLVKAHPELLKTEEYQTLMDNMIKTNTFLISATEHKDVINGIYRAEHSVKEKEFGEIKSFKVSGFKVVPYKTKKEFDKIKEVCSDISVEFNDLIYGGFVVLDKENQFVAHFEYAKEKRRDFVNISYTKSDIVDEKLFAKLLSRLTDYAYEFFGGIYFFVEIEDASEKMVKKLKEYGYKKSTKLENTFYQDKNAELGVISLISIE
jgi:hypothetical protein